jgi:two-component system response regulator PilR (NtrC family)
MPSHRPRALVIDDEPDIRDLLAITLGRMQIDVEPAGDFATAIR